MEPHTQPDAQPIDHDAERAELLQLARESIRAVATTGRLPDYVTANPWFLEPAAVFVTLRGAPSAYEPQGELRGCVGQVEPDAPLYAAVQDAAAKAATIDPRFYPEMCIRDRYSTVMKRLTQRREGAKAQRKKVRKKLTQRRKVRQA